MKTVALYDDRIAIPEAAQQFLGIERFGQLLYRKRTLAEHTRSLFEASGTDRVVRLRGEQDADRVLASLRRESGAIQTIYWPACVAAPDRNAAGIFLRKLRHSQESFRVGITAGATSPAVLVFGPGDAGLVSAAIEGGLTTTPGEGPSFHPIGNGGGFRDLLPAESLVEFLSTTFDARAFNTVDHGRLTVRKRSADVTKMRREAKVFELLPPALRMFFLPTLAYHEEGGHAVYETERLMVPDMAIQWVHRAFTVEEFGVFLDRVLAFVAMRPLRPAPRAESVASLYVGKIEERMAKLKQAPLHGRLASLIAEATDLGSLDHQVERFRSLWLALSPRRKFHRQAVSHGDLCLSNILYARSTRLMRFIDPRGGDGAEDLWLDEYYDLAKLSHSILGLYDFINHDLCDLHADRDLSLALEVAAEELEPLQQLFRERVGALGYDLGLLRLYEASLFLSMLPLHVDTPKKVLAFLIVAGRIMDGLESGRI